MLNHTKASYITLQLMYITLYYGNLAMIANYCAFHVNLARIANYCAFHVNLARIANYCEFM